MIRELMEWLYALAKKGVELAKALFLALASRFYGYESKPKLPSQVATGEVVEVNGQKFRIAEVRIDRGVKTGYWAVPE